MYNEKTKTELNNTELSLYMRVYSYYRELIVSGQLTKGERLPSVRGCAKLLKMSRNTVETAYFMLAADGYIYSKPQSGYYVVGVPGENEKKDKKRIERPRQKYIKFDFSTKAVDRDAFDLTLWQRYIKSALRQEDRLRSYGEPQGEYELRSVLCEYAQRNRNVICSPGDIVVGAGTQSLLQLLCPLLLSAKTVSVPDPSFSRSARIFGDYGFELHYRDKDADIIYVAPSHMNKSAQTMSIERRLELLDYTSKSGAIIVEDDYESEFQYLHRPVPALQSLAGGRGVVYLGTFSRLLLPSIRISYMVLPSGLAGEYQKRADDYNQTASKAEQIALCQFIRDGHLEAQTRRLRRLYEAKTERLYEALRKSTAGCGFKTQKGCLSCRIELIRGRADGSHGYEVKDELCSMLESRLAAKGVLLDGIVREPDGAVWAVFSSIGMSAEQMDDGCELAVQLLAQNMTEEYSGTNT